VHDIDPWYRVKQRAANRPEGLKPRDEWFKAVELEAMRSTCPPKWHWLNNPWKVSHPADRRKHRAKY
jgi:hypothetical protein